MEDLLSEHVEIADSRLTNFLQKQIELRGGKDKRLKKFALCGSQRITFTAPAIFLVSNGERSRYYGLARCHSSWGCPTCTAKRMAEYGSRIACAIDALKTKYKQTAMMMTFTIPHGRWMTITDVYTILQNTWRSFTKNTSKTSCIHKYTLKKNKGEDGRAVGEAGEVRYYKKNLLAPFPNMRHDLDMKHSVRVYEFTWSPTNGWHPHIHAIYWMPNENFDKANDGWEDKLSEHWWEVAKRETLKYFDDKYPSQHESNVQVTNSLFNDIRKNPKTGHKQVYFSKDKNGKVKPVSSAHYISGWGGDTELTHQRKEKHAAEGHYSPYQILQEAYKNPDNPQWINLYLEFLKETFGRKRVQFSARTGINKIVDDWKKTNQWLEVMKKKLTVKAQEKWKVVYWFSDEQWRQIFCLHLQTKLLELAKEPNPKEQINQLLLSYDIQRTETKHWFERVFENETFENKILRDIENAQREAC